MATVPMRSVRQSMRRTLRHCLNSSLAAGVALSTWILGAAPAHADPGDHIQLGNATELAPDIDLGFQYRSNITQAEGGRTGGVAFTVAPGARLAYDTPDTRVQLTGDYRLVKYFTSRLANADQFNDFDINFNGEFLRTSPVGFYLKERPALVNNNADDLGSTPFHTRFRNDLRGGMVFRPGPILEFKVGGAFEYDNIQVPPGSTGVGDVRAYNSRLGGGVDLDAQYLFLPRTAIVVEGDYRMYDWQRNFIVGENNPGYAMPDNTQFRILAGLRGRLTERVVVVGQLGYGASPYDVDSVTTACPNPGGVQCTPGPAAQFDAKLTGLERLLATLQVQYQLDEGRSLTVGYRKDFDDSFFTNYMAYNKVFGTFNTTLGTRFGARAGLSVRQESYRGEISRDDVFFDIRVDGTYKAQEWASVTAALIYQQRVSQISNVEYFDVQPRVFATFTY